MSEAFIVTVGFSVKTCLGGHVYAVPNWIVHFRCPMCAQREWLSLQNELIKKQVAITHLEHIIAGLRGALKRRKP